MLEAEIHRAFSMRVGDARVFSFARYIFLQLPGGNVHLFFINTLELTIDLNVQLNFAARGRVAVVHDGGENEESPRVGFVTAGAEGGTARVCGAFRGGRSAGSALSEGRLHDAVTG